MKRNHVYICHFQTQVSLKAWFCEQVLVSTLVFLAWIVPFVKGNDPRAQIWGLKHQSKIGILKGTYKEYQE